MKLTVNQIRYLLVIRKLNETKHIIKSVDIARQFDYSRASIHKMMKCLKKYDYVSHECYGDAILTKKGIKASNEYHIKYELIRKKLKSLVKIDDEFDLGICSIIEKM